MKPVALMDFNPASESAIELAHPCQRIGKLNCFSEEPDSGITLSIYYPSALKRFSCNKQAYHKAMQLDPSDHKSA